MNPSSFIFSGITVHQSDTVEHIFKPKGLEGWVIHYTLKGQATVGYGEKDPNLKFLEQEAELLLVPPHAPHDYTHSDGQPWTHYYFLFSHRSELAPLLNWPQKVGEYRWLPAAPMIYRDMLVQNFKACVALSPGSDPDRDELMWEHLKLILLYCHRFNPNSKSMQLDQRIQRAQAFMKENVSEAITLAECAQKADLSVSRFLDLFQEQTGMTPMKALEQHRMDRAKHYLATGQLPIQEVAVQCGYNNSFYFSKVFKTNTGKTPSQYRKDVS